MICSAPPAVTASAMAIRGTSKRGQRNRADNIIEIFRNIGASAGTKNDLNEFKIPFANAARLTKKRKGNINLARVTVRENLSGSFRKPGAITVTIEGVKMIQATQSSDNTDNKKASTEDASFLASALPSFVRDSVKTGMNAADIEPSAKSSLKRFGIL